jgi:hypothetical protein
MRYRAGVPAFLKHVPVLGNALRGISVRAVKRLVEDIDRVIDQKNMGVDVLSNFDSRLPPPPRVLGMPSWQMSSITAIITEDG